ncbi:hypothetical protein WICMUC_003694 [Wickerhamomyces mucosus]|uniref:BD-FAE-like domain-containing protein n=1 Tax=Wickerhamomyces mucosus TaxID=1378264 RepID=A0A9P8PKT6_9ASCO|nr:hypothetical protein WICMUC_003694 [Wickerhamomyces mucosus]
MRGPGKIGKRTIEKHSYGDHDRQTFIEYLPFEGELDSRIPRLVFIHGGAWRDPDNKDNDFDVFASIYFNKSIPLSSIDYRLSPEIVKPQHLKDIELAISKFSDSNNLNYIGHSVGVTLALDLIKGNETLFLLDGIYNVELLIEEYPDYKFFVEESGYSNNFKIDFEKLRNCNIIIIHSYNDELLSLKQTNWFCNELQKRKIPYTLKVDDFGTHNNRYQFQVFVAWEISKVDDDVGADYGFADIADVVVVVVVVIGFVCTASVVVGVDEFPFERFEVFFEIVDNYVLDDDKYMAVVGALAFAFAAFAAAAAAPDTFGLMDIALMVQVVVDYVDDYVVVVVDYVLID